MLKLNYKTWIIFIFWSCNLYPFFCDGESDVHKGNQTNHVRRKPYRYVSSLPDFQLPDVHFTFPPFDTQVASAKREIDLSSNSIIRYTPVYEKLPLPTASNQHFEKILNKIKNFKRKLKNHRRLTTPLYFPVSADPLPITPIAVPAYDYFPVGPDYLHQYLQISHKYDMLSCIYLKISEDSFMKVQCYPILPHTDQLETYSINYNNEDLSNPDVANVYHTLIPNAHESYPQESLYDLQLLGTTVKPHADVLHSNAYYFQGNLNLHSTKAGYTPHPLPYHSTPSPPTLSSSVAQSIKYAKPHKVFHFNNTSLPLQVSFPSSGNGLHGNFTDKKLTTLANTYEHQSNRFPVDNKSEMTDNDSPTKISLLNHIIVPLDMEPTEKLDVNKLSSRPGDTVVIETSATKYSQSSSTTDSTLIMNELYIIPGLGITNPLDKTEFTQVSAFPTKRTTLPLSESENILPTITETRFLQYDKVLNGITEKLSEDLFGTNSYDTNTGIEQHVEHTNLPILLPLSEDRDFEPIGLNSAINKYFESTTEESDQFSITTANTNEITTSKFDPRLFTSPIPGNTVFNNPRENPSGKIDNFETTIVDSSPDDLRQLSIITVDSYVTTTQNSSPEDPRQRTPSTDDSFVTTSLNSSPEDLRQLSTSTDESFITTTLNSSPEDLRQLTSNTDDSFVTTTLNSSPDDVKQLSTSTDDIFVSTTLNSLPDDLKQLSTSTDDIFVTTTLNSPPEDLRQLTSITDGSFVTTTMISSPDDLKQLTSITDDSFITTTLNSSPEDLRQLSTSTDESFRTTTVNSSPEDLRQLTSSTGDSFVTTTLNELPDGLRQLSTSIDDITPDNIAPDLRQPSESTIYSYVTTAADSATDNFRQLPRSTVQSFGTNTVINNSPDDFSQLFSSTTVGFFTTTVDISTDVRQLTIGNTVDSSTDDLRTIPISNTEGTSTSKTTEIYDNLRHLKTISSESSTFVPDQVPTTTFKQISSLVISVLTDSNKKIVPTTINESLYYASDSVASTEPMNIDNLPLRTTDDRMTWFTSDLEDSTIATIPLALVRSESPDDSSTTPSDARVVKKEETTIKYTTSQYNKELTGKSIEDNEIIPHQTFTENANGNIELFHGTKFTTQINDLKLVNIERKNSSFNINKTYAKDKVKLDKNNILSLSSEDIKQGYGRKIPLHTDEGNIVKVLEKNINTGKWEVQFYKVDPNNTSLNSEDIELPRRSDVLISDYDGYDNIDSDGEIQYEYDYRGKNTSAVDHIGKLSETSKFSFLNYEVTEIAVDVNKSEKENRRSTYNIKEIEHLNNSYKILEESNSTVLSDIRDIAQNKEQNNKKSNLNVNYLDDFLKLTNKVKQYYDDKKENLRTKRNILIDPPTSQITPSNTTLFESFNGSFFDVGRKIKTTTELQRIDLNTVITEGSINKVFIYKQENTSNVKQNDLSKTPNFILKLINNSSSLEPQRNASSGEYDTSSKADQLKTNQIVQDKFNSRNGTSTEGNFLSFFQNFKKTLKSKSNNYSMSTKTEVYNNSQLNVSNNSLRTTPTSQAVKNIPFKKTFITTINLMKNITTLLRKQNSSANGPTFPTIDPIEEELIPTDKTHKLEFKFGKVMNATRFDVIYVPMYVEVLLVTQIILLIMLLVFFVFLHHAGSRLSKRRQFDSSVSYVNNGFDADRIFNNLP